jgi:hypothetical protein
MVLAIARERFRWVTKPWAVAAVDKVEANPIASKVLNVWDIAPPVG